MKVFAFDRTVSRLLEMQSQPYLHASTVRYPVESGGSDWLLREITGGKSKIIGEGKHRNHIYDGESILLFCIIASYLLFCI